MWWKSIGGCTDLKKIAALCLTIILAFSLPVTSVLASAEYPGSIDDTLAVMLLDEDSGAVLYEQNADETIRPASTTKIMTCILALESCSLDDVVDVGEDGDWSGSAYSLLGCRNGEKIVLKDLLYGMMLVSGNDAACAVAVHVAGSMDAFVAMMNDKAQALGMAGSHFANPHGVDDDAHYVTARDMSKLALYAMQNEQFRKIVSTASYDMPGTNVHSAHTVENTNKLIQKDESAYYAYATGIKTGSTPKAGDCLAASATKDGVNLICLFYGDQSSSGASRWSVPADLFAWGLDTFKTEALSALLEGAPPLQTTVEDAAASDSGALEFDVPADAFVTLERSVIDAILGGEGAVTADAVYNADTPLQAPIAKGTVLGVVQYKLLSTGEVICQCNLVAPRDISRANSGPDSSAIGDAGVLGA